MGHLYFVLNFLSTLRSIMNREFYLNVELQAWPDSQFKQVLISGLKYSPG